MQYGEWYLAGSWLADVEYDGQRVIRGLMSSQDGIRLVVEPWGVQERRMPTTTFLLNCHRSSGPIASFT